MSIVVLEQLSLSFGGKRIVEDLSLRIAEGDRLGLIGPNGSGKTTLLRLIAGEQTPDSGTIRTSRGVRVGWLSQELSIDGGGPILEFILSSVPGRKDIEAQLAAVEKDYEVALAAMGDKLTDDENLLELAVQLGELHEKLAHFETTFSPHEAMKILAGLGFEESDYGRNIEDLSGGWKVRAVLASLLFQQPDVLLLDEPTNHLDMPSVAWFSGFLKRYRQPFILISHDREFLNEQINKVVSLEVEGIRQYPGDYEAYLKQRAEEEVLLENKAVNLGREREKALQFITRFRAQASKAKAVQSRVKALEKMEKVETYKKRKVMTFSFAPTGRAGHQVVSVNNVRKQYGDRVILPGVTTGVYRGDRIGIIGSNGAGKTTLLKLIAGEIKPESGSVDMGHGVKPGYYAQHHAELLHPKNTVIDEVFSVNREVGQTRVRSVLGAFLFSGDDVDKSVGVLSGGERARVALAKLLLDPGNLLLLDEPTNHLDLQSCESLIETLTTYDGTMIFVSHNRALVRRLATKIWSVERGEVTEYPGNLDDYMEVWSNKLEEEETSESASPTKAQAGSPEAAKKSEETGQKDKQANNAEPPAKKKSRGSREEQKRRKREEAQARKQRGGGAGALRKKVATLEKRIAELETKQEERNAQLCRAEGFANDAARFEVLNALQVDAEKIEELSTRWERTQAELDQAEREEKR